MKFYAKFGTNNCLVVYPPRKKGHYLFIIPLDKIKTKDLVLLLDTINSILEMEFTSYSQLTCYLAYRGIFN